MNIENIRDLCLSLKATEETLPFGPDTLVFKVMGKMFALISITNPDRVNLKCDPEYAAELRERYDEIIPGYHMNKKYWNSVTLNGGLDEDLVKSLVIHSYNEVIAGLPKKLQVEYNSL